MFEDSLIESGGKLKTKRGWTSIVSFAIQIMIIGVMVLIPLIFTEALPKQQLMTFLVAPPPPPPPPPPPAAAPVKVVKQIQTDIVNGELRTPDQDSQENSDDQGGRSPSTGHGIDGRRGWGTRRRAWWFDGRRNRQRVELRSGRSA